jgi:hypothetical protein
MSGVHVHAKLPAVTLPSRFGSCLGTLPSQRPCTKHQATTSVHLSLRLDRAASTPYRLSRLPCSRPIGHDLETTRRNGFLRYLVSLTGFFRLRAD